MSAAALGAASVFWPHWDPEDHWATPDRHAVVIIEHFDVDDSFDPTRRSVQDLIESDGLVQRAS